MSDLSHLLADLGQAFGHMSLWVKVGFLGQAVFTARFLVQWVASEKRRDSVIPVAFWWLSLAGGLILLSYAIHRRDPVIIVGQAMGLVVYARNLMLVARAKRRAEKRQLRGQTDKPRPTPSSGRPTRVDRPDQRVPWA